MGTVAKRVQIVEVTLNTVTMESIHGVKMLVDLPTRLSSNCPPSSIKLKFRLYIYIILSERGVKATTDSSTHVCWT